jgi:hypothetical protein
MKRFVIASALAASIIGVGIVSLPTDSAAQTATCRSKCNDEEQACLKRTGNKGQCGNTANQCMEKCK